MLGRSEMEQEQKRPNYLVLVAILILTGQALSQTYMAYRWRQTAEGWEKAAGHWQENAEEWRKATYSLKSKCGFDQSAD
jgi:hypothetical protein